MTEAEIISSHKTIHDTLSEDYYQNKLMSKEDFDYYHGQNWDDMEAELITKGYRKLPEPVMDYKAEILALKAAIEQLKEAK